MGIKQIEVYAVTLRYREPFRIAPSISTETHNVIVKIVTDYEVVGWGESSPSKRVTGESAETVIEALDKLAPKLVGTCPLRIEQNIERMDLLVEGNPAAKASVDMALYDILGKTTRKPLFMLIGGYRSEVMTDITLGIKPPKEMAKDALIAVRKGFKALKVKVGTNPSEDVERVKMIREAAGSDVELRVDANQGWTPKEAMDVLTEIAKCDVEFVEQPVSAEDVRGLASVRKHSSIPVMADESVHSPADALRLIQAEAVDMINIKLMKSGGIHKARKIAEVAEAAGVPCMIGCMSESELGVTAAVHLAAAIRNIRYADLDSDLLLRDKLVKNTLKVENSVRPLSSLPGLGVKEIDQKRLGAPVGVYR